MNTSRASTFLASTIFLLMGMDGGGCAQSDLPLSSKDNGFTDLYLVGSWYSVLMIGPGELGADELWYDVRLTPDGDMRIYSYNEDESVAVYSAYTTQVGPNKYLNVRLIDCVNCDDEGPQTFNDIPCPYHILRYQTFVPDDASEIQVVSDDSGHEWLNSELSIRKNRFLDDKYRGRLLFFRWMDGDYVSAAIEQGLVEGDPDCKECDPGVACLTSTHANLQALVAKQSDSIYDLEDADDWHDWNAMIRQPLIDGVGPE